MRTSVNLSSKPFTNHRLLWAGLGVVILAGIWMTLSVSGQKSALIEQAEKTEIQVKAAEAEVARLNQEIEKRQQAIKTVSLKPEESYQLAAARQLLGRKSFSWNRLLSDIENYVPDKARIASIKVTEVFNDERGLAAAVEIKAVGESSNELTEMMTRLDKSGGVFEIGETGQEQAEEESGVPFTINVIYRPVRGEMQ